MKILLPLLCMLSISAVAQVGIKADNTAPISSAQLEVQSSNKAFYPPRMTNAQVKAIASPQVGAIVYDTDLNCLSMYNGSAWVCTGSGTGGSDQNGGGQGNVPGTFSLSKMNANASTYVQFSESATGAGGVMAMVGYYGAAAPAILYNLDGSPALTYTSTGSYDGFVSVFTSAGTLSWGARLGGTGDDLVYGIAADAGGYTASGTFSSTTLTIYNGKASDAAAETAWGTLTGASAGDAFVIRYNLSGVVQWAARQSVASGFYLATVCSDASNAYVFSSGTGTQVAVYNGRASAGADVLWGNTSASAGTESAALVKYSLATGAVQWVAKTEGSTLYADDVAIGGNFLYTLSDGVSLFQPYNARTTAVATETGWGATTTVGGADAYLTQFNASTGTVNWVARQAGGGTDFGVRMAVDAAGNAVVTGPGTSIAANPFYIRQARLTSASPEVNWGILKSDFDNGKLTFIAKYNSAGNVQWASHIGSSSTSTPNMTDLTIDKNGSVYLCGGYASSSNDVYNGKATGTDAETIFQTLPYTPATKAYIVKYTFSGKAEWVSKLSTVNGTSSNLQTTISNYQPTTATLPVLFGGGAYVGKVQLGSTVVSTTSTGGDLFWFKYVTSD